MQLISGRGEFPGISELPIIHCFSCIQEIEDGGVSWEETKDDRYQWLLMLW